MLIIFITFKKKKKTNENVLFQTERTASTCLASILPLLFLLIRKKLQNKTKATALLPCPLSSNGEEASLSHLRHPEALHQEAMGVHWPTIPPRIQTRYSPRHPVPCGEPCLHQGPAMGPHFKPGDRLRHQVLHSRPASQPPSDSPDCA